jgi:hypothetical protein
MPFMPEMLSFCGRQFQVRAVAHKTCETAHRTWTGRSLHATVHLESSRCDGCSHGGCEADCTLFWKDAWLKPVGAQESAQTARPELSGSNGGCTLAQLRDCTQLHGSPGEEPRYFCQATALYDATRPLAWWDIRQYVRDVTTGNHPPGRVLRVLWLAILKHGWQHSPVGYRFLRWFREWMHRQLTGRDVPDFRGVIGVKTPTPTVRLDLKPGDLVRIRTKEEIIKTLDETGRNRGLSFDVEMSPYCGGVARVRRPVTRIVDELTGEMRHMKQPCITLEGVACNAQYSECRLLCPRAIRSYWREAWLEKVPVPEPVPSSSPSNVAQTEEYAGAR